MGRVLAAVLALCLLWGRVAVPHAEAAEGDAGTALSEPTSEAPSSAYWMAGADGSVRAFRAPVLGSMAGMRLASPVVGITATHTGRGYWLVAADGAVFAFGDARFFGSLGGVRLNRPIVGMATTPASGGYWLVADDGGVFAFGAPFYGSTGGVRLNRPIVGMAPSFRGYTLVAGDGGVFPFGDARFAGSAGGTTLPAPIVGMAVDVSPRLFVPGQRGYDISWPQCGGPYPPRPFDISVVGVNGGRPFTSNPCFVDQATRWASPDRLDVYINLNRPPDGYTGGCAAADLPCIARTFGREAARWSVASVRSKGVAPRLWWLDIEGPTTWYAQTNLNALIIQAAADALEAEGLTVGLYGTRFQYNAITGGYATRSPLPLWAAGTVPLQRCSEPWAGGYVVLSQVLGSVTASGFDENHAC